MNEYHSIATQADFTRFLEETNDLHDGYIISVQYQNDGIVPIPHGHAFHPEKAKLRIQILVTSIFDTVVELLFSGIAEWQIKDSMWDMTQTAISFTKEGQVIWTNDYSTAPEVRKDCSYVIAASMKWKIVNFSKITE